MRRPGRILHTMALLSLFAAGGCFGRDYAFVEDEDVALEPVRSMTMRSGGEYGDVYTLSLQSAHEVNGWVGESVRSIGEVLDILGDYPPTSEDGPWAVYGPFEGASGRDLSFAIRIQGDEEGSSFEGYVGPRTATSIADMDLLLAGSVDIEASTRRGSFTLNFDALEAHPDLKRGPDVDRSYSGKVDITFERDLDTQEKHVELEFTDFAVQQEIPVPEYFAAEHYGYHREADGAGAFDLSIVSTFQTQLWSGPERERMTLGLDWNADGAGRAEGTVSSFEGEGDLSWGDFEISECFGADGLLTWRTINEPYSGAFPGYDMGDAQSCVEIDAASE